jgi:hypothetical protein
VVRKYSIALVLIATCCLVIGISNETSAGGVKDFYKQFKSQTKVTAGKLDLYAEASGAASWFGTEIKAGAVYVVLDGSGSMSSRPYDYPAHSSRWKLAKEETENLIRGLPVHSDTGGESWFGECIFGTGLGPKINRKKVTDPLTPNASRPGMLSYLPNNQPGGSTNYGAGIDHALGQLKGQNMNLGPDGHRTLCILGDGQRNRGASWDTLYQHIRQTRDILGKNSRGEDILIVNTVFVGSAYDQSAERALAKCTTYTTFGTHVGTLDLSGGSD